MNITCRDEPYDKLVPILKWNVGETSNPTNCMTGNSFDVGIDAALSIEDRKKLPYLYGKFSRWSIGQRPLWLNFSNPSIQQLSNTSHQWNEEAVVVPEGCNNDSWVYLLITGNTTVSQVGDGSERARKLIQAAHPVRN